MSYKNATDIFPTHLLEEIQKYTEGQLIYIPKSSSRKHWGESTGIRASLKKRNVNIRLAYQNGQSIHSLSQAYLLSESAIKKIIYHK